MPKSRRFFNYAKGAGIESIGKINKYIIEDYTLEMIDKMNKKISVNSNLRTVRAFCNYCFRNGYIEDKFKVNMLKTQKKIKGTYTDKELKLLLEKPDLKSCDFGEYRRWVIINLMMSTGNRVKTIRNIKVKDLDFEIGYIRLRATKNRYQQIIPFGNRLQEVIREYIEYREGKIDEGMI